MNVRADKLALVHQDARRRCLVESHILKTWIVVTLGAFVCSSSVLAGEAKVIRSPDRKTEIIVTWSPTGLSGRVTYDGQTVVSLPALGLARRDQAFVEFSKVEVGPLRRIDEEYVMLHGKRRNCRNHAAEQTLILESRAGGKMELIVRAYDDGVAFRYRFPEISGQMHTVTGEHTQFGLPQAGRVWAHPYDKATEYTPAYETYYVNGVAVGTPSRDEEGWAFPLLFCNEGKTRWGLITEAGLDGSYCGCRLEQEAPGGVYSVRFPSAGEGNETGSVAPASTLPWATPWRVIILGDSLGDIVESTLVTDVSPPSIIKDTSWIKPGRASWSWLSDHDSPQDFDKLKSFVDLAAEMGWEYSLVDANWTIMKNGTIHDLIAHADSKGVGLLLWYNSGGPHNFVSEMPRGLMYFEKIRRKEFQRLRDWGVKGVKVDFFQSDKQNVIRLYHDILKDAADFQIMVNFHGCTLPRGWSRTYPHLMSMESMRGEECYSFDPRFTKEAPVHNTILPFTRNVVGPMDYTPVMFEDNRYPHLTTYAHELALPVVFESAWLHFADSVEACRSLPNAPTEFLKNIPVAWDETRFLAGEPGDYIVLARRHGDTWYIGGINGREARRDVTVPLSFLDGSGSVMLIQDGQNARTFDSGTRAVRASDNLTAEMKPYGGFAAVITPIR
jgi:hypothetical protein